MNKKTAISALLGTLDEETRLGLWREYCDNNNYPDDEIYPMDMIDEMLGNRKPSDILRDIDGNFNLYHNYFCFTIYGIKSFDYVECYDSPYDGDALADWIAEGNCSSLLIADELLGYFTEYANEHKPEDYKDITEDEASDLLLNNVTYWDFIDDDWDDLVAEMFNTDTKEE